MYDEEEKEIIVIPWADYFNPFDITVPQFCLYYCNQSISLYHIPVAMYQQSAYSIFIITKFSVLEFHCGGHSIIKTHITCAMYLFIYIFPMLTVTHNKC